MLVRTVHLIWLGDDSSGVAAGAVAHWQRMGNGRRVVLHTGDDALLNDWRPVWEKHAKTAAMQSDLLRWSLLLTIGGWYFDCDVRSRLTLDEIEAECGLDGGRCFLTKVGRGQSPPFTDIAACNPDWLGRQTVLDCVPQQLDADVRYLTFANLMFWPMVVERPELFAFGAEERYGIVAADPAQRVFVRNAGASIAATTVARNGEKGTSQRGPGTCLHDAIVRWTGEFPNAGCQCRRRIERMNQWGPATCRQKLKRIVGWLRSEARKRNWVLRFGVAVPGAQFAIRRMVLNAIEESEREQLQ